MSSRGQRSLGPGQRSGSFNSKLSRENTAASRIDPLTVNSRVMDNVLRDKRGPSWEDEADEEGSQDSDDRRNGRRPGNKGPDLPPGLEWLGGVVKPIDDIGKTVGQLFCPFLMPVTQDQMVKDYCEELEKDRLDLAAQNQALAAELEKLKLSQAKKKGSRGKSELDRFVDLRILLSNLKPGRLSEEEGVLRTCWAAWDARDRPLKDLIVARSGKNQRSSSPPSPSSSMNRQRSGGGGSRAGSVSGASVRSEDRQSYGISVAQLESNSQKAAACAQWIVTMLQVKQVAPETVTSEEMGPLLGLMYSFPKVEEVQDAGAEALALIAVDESEQSKLAPEDLVEEGAITVLLTAMKTHRNNAHLQEQAGSALLHMASRSGDVAVEIRQAGGQKAIQAAIKLHPQLKYLRTYLDELLQDSSPGGRLQMR